MQGKCIERAFDQGMGPSHQPSGSELLDHWYVVYTKPKSEYKARENLANQGFKALMPETKALRMRAGKRVHVVEPLFSRYVFVQILQHQTFYPIRSTIGCSSLLRFDDKAPCRVSSDIIHDVMLLCQSPIDVTFIADDIPQKGDKVLIKKGIFKDNTAIFLEPCGTRRSWLLLEMMGSKSRLQVENGEFIKN